jgi:hypothetical protein
LLAVWIGAIVVMRNGFGFTESTQFRSFISDVSTIDAFLFYVACRDSASIERLRPAYWAGLGSGLPESIIGWCIFGGRRPGSSRRSSSINRALIQDLGGQGARPGLDRCPGSGPSDGGSRFARAVQGPPRHPISGEYAESINRFAGVWQSESK